ncbi:hypothetical protein SSTU70S_01047 [Stutzerimonas stutzeri]
MIMIPLRCDEFDDRILGLFKRRARLFDHQLVDLRNIGRGQMTGLVLLLGGCSHHAGQGRLYVKQRAGDIHQRGIVRLTQTRGQRLDQPGLVDDDLARLGEAQHREGVGNLLQRGMQTGQIVQCAAVATHE